MIVHRSTRLVTVTIYCNNHTKSTHFILVHENDKARSDKGGNTQVHKASEQKKK